MALLSFLYRNGLWLAPPAFCAAVALLILSIFSVVGLMRASVIVRLPLAGQQEVEFPEAGKVILCEEGPRFTQRFGRLTYRLADRAGMLVPGRKTLPLVSSGISTARKTARAFHIPEAGQYKFLVDGLGGPDEQDAQCSFVFTRPHFGGVILRILGIIASASLLIGSIVLFGLRLAGTRRGESTGPAVAPRTVITAAGIVSVIVAALVLSLWSNRNHRNAVRTFALAQGWQIAEGDPAGVSPRIGHLFPDRTFLSEQTITVESRARQIYLADGTYSHHGPKADAHLASACVLDSDALAAVPCRIEISSNLWVDKALLSGQVTLEDSPFSQEFLVLSEDPEAARRLLGARLQQVLLAHTAQPRCSPVEVAIGKGRIVLIARKIDEMDCWNGLVALAKEIEAAL